MSQLALAGVLGMSEKALVRLQRAGLDEAGAERVADLAKFIGGSADDLVPYIEKGVTLPTLEAVAQIRKSSALAETTSFGVMVSLGAAVGELSPERTLEEGMTIYRGLPVSPQQLADIQKDELERAAAKAGVSTGLREANQEPKAIDGPRAPGSSEPESQSVTEPAASDKPRLTVVVAGAAVEGETAQEKVMSTFLETLDHLRVGGVDRVQLLVRFIDKYFDGNGLRAYAELLEVGESEFVSRLARFSRINTSFDPLLDDIDEEQGLADALVLNRSGGGDHGDEDDEQEEEPVGVEDEDNVEVHSLEDVEEEELEED